MANCVRCGRQLPPLSFKKVCQWCVQHEAAQRGDEADDAKQIVLPAPWVRRGQSSISLTQVLFGANVAVYLAMALASSAAMDFPGETMVRFGANFGPYTLSGDWWRLVTYMFLHAGILHIAFNMWCLWDLGALCESLYGRWTYAAVYFITGISGGLASISWNPRVLSVGASGAIFGLAGALIASFYLGEFSLPNIAIRGTLRSLVIFAVFNLGFGGLFGGIDNACHIGGLVSGLILGAMIARFAPQQDAVFRRLTVLGVIALAVVAAGLGVRQWRGAPMRMARAFQELSQEKGSGIDKLQKIAREHSDQPEPHMALGQAYFESQDFSQAETEFRKVLQLQPQNTEARFDLGVTNLNEQRPDDAKAAFSQILAQDSNNADGHYGMGLVFADEGQYQSAINEFKSASAQPSQISGLYFQMGHAYAKLQMYDDAIAAYLKEKANSGDDPSLEIALANAYDAKGMTQQAQDARSKAEQLKGNPSGR